MTTQPALEQAFVHYQADLYRFALRRTRNHHDAEEVTQQAFADAATALLRREAPTSLRGWLYTVAERRIADEARRKARIAALAERLGSERTADEADMAVDALADAVAGLSEQQRQLVWLRVVEGRSFREISRALGCDEGTCRMRLTRALRQLRDELRTRRVTKL